MYNFLKISKHSEDNKIRNLNISFRTFLSRVEVQLKQTNFGKYKVNNFFLGTSFKRIISGNIHLVNGNHTLAHG